MAINHSRYTMHLIKILITTTSPLCTLEKEKLWSSRKHIQNLLDNYKRTLEDIKRKIPYLQWQLSMAGCRLYEAQTWIKMACSNARSTPGVIDVRIQIAWPCNQIQVCCTMSASLLNIDNQLCQKLLNVMINKTSLMKWVNIFWWLDFEPRFMM